jgi:serine/threonine protein kinase
MARALLRLQGVNIGQYRIKEKLGNGGMGTVYVGEHILLGRPAAIKILQPALSAHREVVERFFNEARATSAIADPGVVQVFDFGYHVDGTAYIVMELLEGEALATRIHRLGKLAVGDALRIARQIAASLDAVHARGIVHRDLKPANIFLVRDPQAQGGERTKLLDFGICKVELDANPRLTGGEAMLGTPVYMAPEQCRNAGLADQRSDIYALGGVVFHMLTGRTPFQAESTADFIAAHLTEAVSAPSLFADVPPAIDALVLRCMEKAPDDRFQSMAELQAGIDELLPSILEAAPTEEVIPLVVVRDRAVRAPTPAPSLAHRSWFVSATPLPTTLEPPPRRSRGLRSILAVGLIVAGAATYLALTSEEAGTPVRAMPAAKTTEPMVSTSPPADAPSEVTPAEPVTDAAKSEPETPSVTPPPPPETPKPQPPAVKRPVVRQRQPASKPPATEDLYDTR